MCRAWLLRSAHHLVLITTIIHAICLHRPLHGDPGGPGWTMTRRMVGEGQGEAPPERFRGPSLPVAAGWVELAVLMDPDRTFTEKRECSWKGVYQLPPFAIEKMKALRGPLVGTHSK